jgi:hypothetical protein
MRTMWLTGGVYHDWAAFLERWASGDSTGIDRLPPVRPEELTADTLNRLAQRIADALGSRLRTWSDQLARAMAAGADEFSVGRALTQARAGLRSMRALAGHPALSAELREQLQEMVDRQVVAGQQMLEDDLDRLRAASADPRRVEARRRTLRENSLTAVLDEAAPWPVGPAEWLVDPAAPSRRRPIIG